MSFVDLSQDLLDDLTARAAVAPRRRLHHNLHARFDEPCQRLLNAIGIDSYIRPHRHALDPKGECLICVRGCMGLLTFDDSGAIIGRLRFGYGGADARLSVGAEVPPGIWHTVVALEPASVLLEVKSGPFNPNAAKELAPWAPAEGSPEVPAYLAALRRAFDD